MQDTNLHNIDKPLLSFETEKGDAHWTIKASFSGLTIVGGTGSGKSSGSARTIAKRLLRNNYGGLVLTVKEDELDSWRQFCTEEGRSNDLIVVEPEASFFFNFLEYISTIDTGENYAQNIFKCIKEVIKANEQRTTGKGDDMFWDQANDMYLKNLIQLTLLAYGKVTIELLFDIAQTAPRIEPIKIDDAENAFLIAYSKAKENVKELVAAWNEKQGIEWIKNVPQIEYEKALGSAVKETKQFKRIKQFFYTTLFSLSSKTRSIIDFYFTGFLDTLLDDPIYRLFCEHPSNYRPEDCYEGKIIVINLPVKKYDKAGQNAQMMFKYIWQLSVERRDIKANGRPIFLYQDEGQEFVIENDTRFQTTARSSRVATVLITQNLANIYAAMGGDKAEYRVKSLLGNLSTKIFHANGDVDTNLYASKLIGKGWSIDPSSGIQIGKDVSMSSNEKWTLLDLVRPEEFAMLANGGAENNYEVEAYIHVQNAKFPNRYNFQKIVFHQNQ